MVRRARPDDAGSGLTRPSRYTPSVYVFAAGHGPSVELTGMAYIALAFSLLLWGLCGREDRRTEHWRNWRTYALGGLTLFVWALLLTTLIL